MSASEADMPAATPGVASLTTAANDPLGFGCALNAASTGWRLDARYGSRQNVQELVDRVHNLYRIVTCFVSKPSFPHQSVDVRFEYLDYDATTPSALSLAVPAHAFGGG
jgi:hypothetical protein